MNPAGAEFLEKPNPFQLSVSIWNNTMGTWFKVVISPYQMKKSKSSLFSSERIKGGLTTRREGPDIKIQGRWNYPLCFDWAFSTASSTLVYNFETVLFHAHFLFLQQKWIFIIRPVLPCSIVCLFLWKCSFCLVFYFQTRFASKLLGKSLCSTKRKNNNFVILTIFLC